MHNVVKWPNILQKFCGIDTARLVKYIWQFFEHYAQKGKLLYEITN